MSCVQRSFHLTRRWKRTAQKSLIKIALIQFLASGEKTTKSQWVSHQTQTPSNKMKSNNNNKILSEIFFRVRIISHILIVERRSPEHCATECESLIKNFKAIWSDLVVRICGRYAFWPITDRNGFNDVWTESVYQNGRTWLARMKYFGILCQF